MASGNTTNQNCNQALIRNSPDIIVLNVGGNLITTCSSTLTRHSPYFEAMFSKYWTNSVNDGQNDNADCSEERESTPFNSPIFIDKDPRAFQYILSYMREGYMSLPEDKNGEKDYYGLVKNIICQAQYFGLSTFISHVKLKTVQNCVHHGKLFNFELKEVVSTLPPSDQMIDAFDEKYETLLDAFDDGCLPYFYLEKYQDEVCIQVGNMKYALNKTNLTAKSQLLAEMIKEDSLFQSSRRTYFIDQDPEVFKYLLYFIRYSQLDLPHDDPNLFARVMQCAKILQMDDFIILVKARTMSNLERHEAPMGFEFMDGSSTRHLASVHEVTDTDRRNATFFDQRFQSIDNAFESNKLPDCFFHVSMKNKSPIKN